MERSKTIEFVKVEDITPYLENVDCDETGEDTFEWLEENGDEICAIREGDTVVGLAILEEDGFLYVYIFPTCRNRGYGRLAVAAAEQRMKDTLPANRRSGSDRAVYDGNDPRGDEHVQSRPGRTQRRRSVLRSRICP